MESTSQANLLTPIQGNDRIASLDIMRGFVLFGILLMNINAFGLYNAYNDPTVTGGFTGLNRLTWISTNLFFEGTMRGLFSLLFGVGMFIFLDRLEKKGAGITAADVYFRRLIWLLFFGILHGYIFLWPGEILFDYALMGFLVFSFRKLQPKRLILYASILFLIGGTWNYFDYKAEKRLSAEIEQVEQLVAQEIALPDSLKGAKEVMEKRAEERSQEKINEANKKNQGGYFDVLAVRAPINMEFEKMMFYRYNAWDVLSMMLLGIALFKLNILSAEKSSKTYWLMVLLGYGIGLTVNWLEITHIMDNSFSPLAFYEANITYDVGRVAVSMGHVGLILLFCQANFLKGFKRSMAAVGKMALTNYFMHSVICMFVFTGMGFGLFGKLERYELLYVVFGTWIFQLIISPIWLKYYLYGPMEWLWRCLSYQKRYPFRKTTTSSNSNSLE
ncbi:uncharacterized protein DFQ04_1688 [Algoriphagus boseongensis]|uniref:DUF418 domain-containing protein n=1 Tax=Algoriphagus boseongensis TaxID=1442587 RepID=A0A4V3D251_9BACT|nr:DUF418 domain-containing protein [Algoriphagus boseongensis]TDQ17040.1 uncharacterized protein DFQ04_1688 [Algoriphagus boseongensis]